MVKPASPESYEQRCPACGVAFRLADRRKRVQCPRCMEIIEIASDKTPARLASAAGAKDLAAMKAQSARIDQLEARIEALEQTIAELRSAPEPSSARPPLAPMPAVEEEVVPEEEPEAAPKLIWHEPRLRDIASAGDEMPAAQHEALVANLTAIGRRRIVIQAAADDASAAHRASRLHEIFEEAKWVAPPVVTAPERLCSHPLSLVAQAGSTPQEMAALFTALAAAGFKAVSQIDPSLDGNAPILAVGSQS